MMEGVLVFWKYRTLFSLFLCTLALFRVHLAQAVPAPQQNIDPSSLSKISPRGSHWAVGHLMGKKSIEEYPYGYDGGDKVLAAAYFDKPMEGYQQWKEALISILRMLETSDSRNNQPIRDTVSFNKKLWDTEDNNNYKEILDYLYQLMNMRENSQS
ncbi:gastrin-releasing peptide [Pelobates fuscus]|uniref:gastrin-releasing peptide n=1 Tax=Pelobates fuscus TaxID=191477 RepID=UPI002FE4B5D9